MIQTMEVIDLKTFIDGYKKAEIVLNDKKRVFREPTLKDMQLSIEEILKKYCLEGDAEDFLRTLDELPKSQYKECLDTILKEVGLV